MSQHTFYLAVEERVVVDLESELIKGLLMQPVKSATRARAQKPAAAAAAAAAKKKKTKHKLSAAASCQNDEVVQHQQPLSFLLLLSQPLSFLLLLSLLFQLVAPFGSPHRYSDHVALPQSS